MELTDAAEFTSRIKNLNQEAKPERDLYLDTFRHLYWRTPETMVWPSVDLNGPGKTEAERIFDNLISWIPDVIQGGIVLPEARPVKDNHRIQILKPIYLEDRIFAEVLTFESRYLGGARPEEVLEPHRQGVSPSFVSDRIYFFARLLPIQSFEKSGEQIVSFHPLEFNETTFHVHDVEIEKNLWRSVVFDEVDYSPVEEFYLNRFSFGDPWRWGKLLRPFVVDHLSLAVNLINPTSYDGESMAKMYNQLLTDGFSTNLDDSVKKFWANWMANWRLERVESRSGNPHWRIHGK